MRTTEEMTQYIETLISDQYADMFGSKFNDVIRYMPYQAISENQRKKKLLLK